MVTLYRLFAQEFGYVPGEVLTTLFATSVIRLDPNSIVVFTLCACFAIIGLSWLNRSFINKGWTFLT